MIDVGPGVSRGPGSVGASACKVPSVFVGAGGRSGGSAQLAGELAHQASQTARNNRFFPPIMATRPPTRNERIGNGCIGPDAWHGTAFLATLGVRRTCNAGAKIAARRRRFCTENRA